MSIIRLLAEYKVESIFLALLINVLTGLVKKPIKHFAKKKQSHERITRFIVLLPLLIGFIVDLSYSFLSKEYIIVDSVFINFYIKTTSLSLSFYAIYEKLFSLKVNKKCGVDISKQILLELDKCFNSVSLDEKAKSLLEKNYDKNKHINN